MSPTVLSGVALGTFWSLLVVVHQRLQLHRRDLDPQRRRWLLIWNPGDRPDYLYDPGRYDASGKRLYVVWLMLHVVVWALMFVFMRDLVL